MKICFFTTGVFPVSANNIKAVENWTYNLARSLKNRGHEIVIFGSSDSAEEFEVVSPDEIMTEDLALKDSKKYGSYLNKYFSKCLNYVANNSVDIIHDQTSILSILEKSKDSKVPMVSTFHLIRDNQKNKKRYSKLNFLHNISPSKYLAKVSFPLKFEKIIPHGINTEEFAFNSDPEDYFIFVGKIIETKGPINAVNATLEAKKNLQICGGSMVGEENEKYYQKFLREIERKHDIKYLGKTNKKNVANLMGRAKALIMSSIAPEAFGLVMIEALSCGTPVIAFDIGTAREIVEDSVNGFLIPSGNIEKMAEAMSKIEKIDRNECRRTVENNFNFNIMVNKYEDTYLEILKNE